MEPFVQTILAIMAMKNSGLQMNEEEYLYYMSCLRVQTLINKIRAIDYEKGLDKYYGNEETPE